MWYRSLTILPTCTIASDTVRLTLSQLTADAGADQAVCPGSDVTLGGTYTGNGSGGYMFMWDFGAGTVANPTVTVSADITYAVMVTDSLGCEVTDSIFVDVIEVTEDSVEFFSIPVANALQTFTFPQCIDSVEIKLWGRAGMDGQDTIGRINGIGGLGGYVRRILMRDNALGHDLDLLSPVARSHGPLLRVSPNDACHESLDLDAA